MFSGIIEHFGEILEIEDRRDDREFLIANATLAPQLEVGHSVAVNGCCQTITAGDATSFRMHAIPETLRVTTLGDFQVGQRVHLEPALPLGYPLGGHLVQGHVDALATLVSREEVGESERFRFRTSAALLHQMVPKGSVALDGMSLTVGPDLGKEEFDVFLIPHTLEVSTWSGLRPGDRVNIETDIIGKYVERMLAAWGQGPKGDGA